MRRFLLAALVAVIPAAVQAQGALPTIKVNPVIRVTPTDRSGVITLGGQAQQLAAANSNRQGLCIQNLSAGDLWLNTVGTAAAGQPSQWLPSGAEYCMPTSGVAVGAASIFGATTGQTFTAREW